MTDSFSISLRRSDWRRHERHNVTVFVVGAPGNEDALVTAAASADTAGLHAMPGHWAAIVERPGSVALIEDHLRSYPLFYPIAHDDRGVWHVSDDIELMRSLVPDGGVPAEAAEEFLTQGFITGNETLFAAIRQVQTGEQIIIDGAGIHSSTIRRLEYSGANLSDDRELDEAFTRGFDAALDRSLDRVGDRQIVIPLSGGLDSRLLAIAMHDRGISNVKTLTYGVGETREVGISRTVAGALGLDWEFVTYSPEQLAAAWAEPDTAEFVRDTYSGSALPHIQDWYAFRHLRRTGGIAEDAVIFPGHCIVGNMHDEEIVEREVAPSREEMKRLLFIHHTHIRSDAIRLWKRPHYQEKLDRFLENEGYDGSIVSRILTFENYNYVERQTKYINNSVHGYEHFGYDWAMPLLDLEMLDAWGDFAPEITKDRAWYRRYVGRRYAAATGGEIGEFTATNVSAKKREAVKRALRAVGLLTTAERRIKLRAIESHPMGFQAFLGAATPRDLRHEVLAGGTQMGIFTEQFLAETWTPGMNLRLR